MDGVVIILNNDRKNEKKYRVEEYVGIYKKKRGGWVADF